MRDVEFTFQKTVGELIRKNLKPASLPEVVQRRRQNSTDQPNLSLYVHIPFCEEICSFCAFHRIIVSSEKMDRYVGALERHIDAILPHVGTNQPIRSVYIGGGTPGLLSLPQVDKVLSIIRHGANTANTKFTYELHPKNATEDYVLGLMALGINRLSLGVQNLNAAERKTLRRTITSSDEEIKTFQNLNRIGPPYNIDLLYGTVNQTEASWGNTIARIVGEAKPPEVTLFQYVNAYGAATREWINQGKVRRPGLSERHRMFDNARDYLASHGYHQRGMANFSRERNGPKSKLMNSGNDFVGLGPRTYSKIGNTFLINNARVSDFGQSIGKTEDYYGLTVPQWIEAGVTTGLTLLSKPPPLQEDNGNKSRLSKWQAEGVTQIYGILYYITNS